MVLYETEHETDRSDNESHESQEDDDEDFGPPIRPINMYNMPLPIIPELAEFLGVSPTTELSRITVSKHINQYIKAHNLQDPVNGRIIHPDTRLANLMRIQGDDVLLTYFNLQLYMRHFFVRRVVATPVDTVVSGFENLHSNVTS